MIELCVFLMILFFTLLLGFWSSRVSRDRSMLVLALILDLTLLYIFGHLTHQLSIQSSSVPSKSVVKISDRIIELSPQDSVVVVSNGRVVFSLHDQIN